MYSGCELLLRRNPRKQARELRSFRTVECSAESILLLAADLFDLFARLKPGLCQIERVRAPVGGVVPSLYQAALFQLVEHRHEPARKNSQLLAERLLTEAIRLADNAQDARVCAARGRSLPFAP